MDRFEILDHALNLFEKNTNWRDLHLLSEVFLETCSTDLNACLTELESDGFIERFEFEQSFRLTFKGLEFIKAGGYVEKCRREEERKEKRHEEEIALKKSRDTQDEANSQSILTNKHTRKMAKYANTKSTISLCIAAVAVIVAIIAICFR